MPPCATASLFGAFFVVALGAGCGGSAASEPPPATAAEPASAASPADPGGADEPPAAAAPVEAAPKGGDVRNSQTIAAIVRTHRKEARECYEKAQKQIPGLKGDVVIHFTLKPSGQVKHAELNKERSTITEASVVDCVIGVIRAIEFPKSSKGMESAVNYPFNFNP